MAVVIYDIEKNSIAEKYGIQKNDILISINGNSITDVLDYRFYETEVVLDIVISTGGENKTINIKKERYASLGLVFETYLMDKETSCKNGCIFCFIDQLPKGLRKSLYFKDDDHRLSFLFGNYITLTNLKDDDIDRIIKLKISPVNVSVHTMNPSLRVMMMKNKHAGECLKYLKKLSDGGISLNCQLVLCPNINDGKELEYSLNELTKLDGLQSLACVPVGLSGYRENLHEIKPYDKGRARDVIKIIDDFGDKMRKETGERKVFASDEFYFIAEKELPDFDYYEDFPQIENGVGMFRSLEEEFTFALEEAEDGVSSNHVTLVTGEAIYCVMKKLVEKAHEKWDNIKVNIVPVKNHFFGGDIDVTGLITGSDIVKALENTKLYDAVLVPDVCLKADEDIFLDDMNINGLSEKLNCKVKKVGPFGQDLLNALLGKDD